MFSSLFIGHEIKLLEKVDSTNSYALNLLSHSSLPQGYIVRALEQQAGRGQRGKQWYSEPGVNLTFSIILHPGFLPITEQFSLTKAIALGIAGFVSHILSRDRACPVSRLVSTVKIKWPNDIYVHRSKIAGILIENILEGSVIKHSVVGIGLNVNQTVFDPALPNPTSLLLERRDLMHNVSTLDECLKILCSFIEKYYLLLCTETSSAQVSANRKQLDDEYLQLLYKKGIWSDFMLNNERFSGKIEGVNKQGHLLMTRKSGINNADSEGDETIEVADIKQLLFI